jgi:ribose/xylose/arabinose/galactoside ABC-type transport system permease subunit
MLAYLGLEKAISKGDYISPSTTTFFEALRFGKVLGMPIMVWCVLIVWLCLSYIMRNTPLGTYLYATGGNMTTAKKAGLNTDLYSFISYGIMGGLCWFASIAYVAQLSGYPPEAAYTNQLEVILAVFFGMALSKKGVINVFGAFLGAAYVGFLANGLGLFGVSSYWIKLVEGTLVVLVILGNSVKHGTLVQLD